MGPYPFQSNDDDSGVCETGCGNVGWHIETPKESQERRQSRRRVGRRASGAPEDSTGHQAIQRLPQLGRFQTGELRQ
jgi:hypothetical protein